MVTESDWRRVAVSSDTMVYSDIAKLQNLRKTMRDGELKVKDTVIQEEDVEKIFDESVKKGDE